ncbi:MAG: DUF262 domain-containing protein, partial [Pseudomonadota bacterium]
MQETPQPSKTSPESTNLVLRSVDALLSERFVVPSYQRGYRWTPRQVTDLLKDLAEFTAAVRDQQLTPEAFYCLQPIVVAPRDDGAWEVIDGQQRLTTLLLLLQANRDYLRNYLKRTPFQLRYETRERSEGFLLDPTGDDCDDNIDFFHMSQAYRTIESWLDEQDPISNNRLFDRVLDQRQNVQVIWYELPPSHDAIDVFVRLNVGKIPLTNAELIRALFLR